MWEDIYTVLCIFNLELNTIVFLAQLVISTSTTILVTVSYCSNLGRFQV
jgi:hypothetical protein